MREVIAHQMATMHSYEGQRQGFNTFYFFPSAFFLLFSSSSTLLRSCFASSSLRFCSNSIRFLSLLSFSSFSLRAIPTAPAFGGFGGAREPWASLNLVSAVPSGINLIDIPVIVVLIMTKSNCFILCQLSSLTLVQISWGELTRLEAFFGRVADVVSLFFQALPLRRLQIVTLAGATHMLT